MKSKSQVVAARAQPGQAAVVNYTQQSKIMMKINMNFVRH
jgi:hypothetical protein